MPGGQLTRMSLTGEEVQAPGEGLCGEVKDRKVIGSGFASYLVSLDEEQLVGGRCQTHEVGGNRQRCDARHLVRAHIEGLKVAERHCESTEDLSLGVVDRQRARRGRAELQRADA